MMGEKGSTRGTRECLQYDANEIAGSSFPWKEVTGLLRLRQVGEPHSGQCGLRELGPTLLRDFSLIFLSRSRSERNYFACRPQLDDELVHFGQYFAALSQQGPSLVCFERFVQPFGETLEFGLQSGELF
jgi:hypothetical protein